MSVSDPGDGFEPGELQYDGRSGVSDPDYMYSDSADGASLYEAIAALLDSDECDGSSRSKLSPGEDWDQEAAADLDEPDSPDAAHTEAEAALPPGGPGPAGAAAAPAASGLLDRVCSPIRWRLGLVRGALFLQATASAQAHSHGTQPCDGPPTDAAGGSGPHSAAPAGTSDAAAAAPPALKPCGPGVGPTASGPPSPVQQAVPPRQDAPAAAPLSEDSCNLMRLLDRAMALARAGELKVESHPELAGLLDALMPPRAAPPDFAAPALAAASWGAAFHGQHQQGRTGSVSRREQGGSGSSSGSSGGGSGGALHAGDGDGEQQGGAGGVSSWLGASGAAALPMPVQVEWWAAPDSVDRPSKSW